MMTKKPSALPAYLENLKFSSDTSLQIQEYAEFDVFWTRMRNAKGPIHPASAIQKQPSVASEHMKSSSSGIQPMKKKVEEPQSILKDIYSSPPAEKIQVEAPPKKQAIESKPVQESQPRPVNNWNGVVPSTAKVVSSSEKISELSRAQKPTQAKTSENLFPTRKEVASKDAAFINPPPAAFTKSALSQEDRPKVKSEVALTKQHVSQKESSNSLQVERELTSRKEPSINFVAKFNQRFNQRMDQVDREASDVSEQRFKEIQEENQQLKKKLSTLEQQMKEFMEMALVMKQMNQSQMPQFGQVPMGQVQMSAQANPMNLANSANSDGKQKPSTVIILDEEDPPAQPTFPRDMQE